MNETDLVTLTKIGEFCKNDPASVLHQASQTSHEPLDIVHMMQNEDDSSYIPLASGKGNNPLGITFDRALH